MSTDRLEEFIRQNRGSFDSEVPDPAIWDRVEKRQPPARRIPIRRIAWQAAAAVIIFMGSYYFHDYMDTRDHQEVAGMYGDEDELGKKMARELVEAEAFYTSQIRFKKDEVFKLAQDQPAIIREVDMELVELDKVFEELKKDLKDNAQNTEVIEAMIQNYRLKLQILEDMLYMLKQNEQSNEDEPIHI